MFSLIESPQVGKQDLIYLLDKQNTHNTFTVYFFNIGIIEFDQLHINYYFF